MARLTALAKGIILVAKWTWLWFMQELWGYGEKPWRVIRFAVSVMLVFALIYFTIGSTWEFYTFWRSLYFSAVSFTALGYGEWVKLGSDVTSDWMRGLGAFEAFIGVSTISLFLITFVRKMTR